MSPMESFYGQSKHNSHKDNFALLQCANQMYSVTKSMKLPSMLWKQWLFSAKFWYVQKAALYDTTLR